MLSSQQYISLAEPGTVSITTSSKDLSSSPQVCTVPVLSIPLHRHTPGKHDNKIFAKKTFSVYLSLLQEYHVSPFDWKCNYWTHVRQVNKLFLVTSLLLLIFHVTFLSSRLASVCVLSLLHARFWEISSTESTQM